MSRRLVFSEFSGSLGVSGVFSEVGEEAVSDFSSCKPSPGSFLSDEPPALRFRALLTDGEREVRFERMVAS
jgi:hypothetical protein